MNSKDRFGKPNSEMGGAPGGLNSSRARNRTVMLTPEMTGQVRSLLSGSEETSYKESDISEQLIDEDGFSKPIKKNTIDEMLISKFEEVESESKVSALDKPDRASQATGHFGGRSGTLTDLSRLIDAPKSVDAVKQSINNLLSISRDESEKRPEDRATGFHARPKIFDDKSSFSTQTLQVSPASNTNSNAGLMKVKDPQSRIIGFLISFDKTDNGEIIEVREGRFHLTSKAGDQNDLIVLDDPSISVLHALIKANGNGEVLILDQLSEHGSGVMHQGSEREEDAAGATVKVFHGDVVRLGRRYFIYCGIPKLDIKG